MKKHPYRALIIWAVIAVALVYIYPTVGWMMLSPETRAAKIEKWDQEDTEWAKSKHGIFAELAHNTKRWAEFDKDWVITLGLDLQGGIHMVLRCDYREMQPEKLKEYEDAGIDSKQIQEQIQRTVLEQIRRRVDEFEAKEPIIQALGDDKIQIQLPGEKDLDRARRLIMMAAVLNFHIVAGNDESTAVYRAIEGAFPGELSPFVHEAQEGLFPLRVRVEDRDRVEAVLKKAAEKPGVIPEGTVVAFSPPPKGFEAQYYKLYVMSKEPMASGEGLTDAYASPDDTNPPYWEILFRMNAAAGAHFGEVTEANINRAMAIVLDGVAVSAPVIRDRISTSGRISGAFEAAEAQDLAIALNSGSMAVPIHEEFTRLVGPSLGRDSVRHGVISAISGVVLVGLFMLVYYLGAGLVSLIALALNAVLIIAAMAYFDLTLTLPGIAGLILTIGMAVDANVLIYERIREELKLGHSLLSSIDNGFSRAAITILDANVTTLIAAFVLLQFGTGPVEGFAITLSIGVCSSVFTALVVSRALIDFGLNKKLITQLKMLSVIKADTRIPFMQGRRVAALISGLLIIGGMTVFGIRGKENLGVDFTQGTNITVAITNDAPMTGDSVAKALEAAGFDSPVVQLLGDEISGFNNEFNIRVREIEDAGAAPENAEAEQPVTVAERVKAACAPLASDSSPSSVEVLDEQTVGPAVGKQLSLDAIKAMMLSLVFIILYLTLRFEWKFAVGAVVALAHDVLITVGMFAILSKQIDMNVVAALLTIIGYSLNDTIVVFDRIREDLRAYRGKGYKFFDILNMAINSTLSRTLLTSLTTLFVVVVLWLFGGRAIEDFALALILGVVVGTYSSIFVASPVVYFLQHRIIGKDTQPTDTGNRNSGGGRAKKKSKQNGEEPATA